MTSACLSLVLIFIINQVIWRFCLDVGDGATIITADDWPSFLYPEDGYDPEAIDENLLRGPFLLSVRHDSVSVASTADLSFCTSQWKCFRHIFTGPRTAMKSTPGKTPGKKCLADLHHMTKVTPGNIAYAAVLVCPWF